MTDQRDPETFPMSSAYCARCDLVKVSAAAALAYGHLHYIEHVADGALGVWSPNAPATSWSWTCSAQPAAAESARGRYRPAWC